MTVFILFLPLEIKARKTITDEFFKWLKDWASITGQNDVQSYVIYNGRETLRMKKGYIYPWDSIADLLKELYSR